MSKRAQKWLALIVVIISTLVWLWRLPETLAGMRDPMNTYAEWIAIPILIGAWLVTRKLWKQSNQLS
jgi:hypothetical protein